MIVNEQDVVNIKDVEENTFTLNNIFINYELKIPKKRFLQLKLILWKPYQHLWMLYNVFH